MPRRLAPFALFALFAALLPALATAYTDYSFQLNATVNADGSAHIFEKTVFTLDNAEEIQNFEYYLFKGETTLVDWQRFSNNIKYHFAGPVSNLRVIAAREFRSGYTSASVSMEYDVQDLFLSEKANARLTQYAFDKHKLSFGSPNELKLSTDQSLSLILPKDAFNIAVTPAAGVEAYSRNELAWEGPLIGSWDVSYDREISLSQEVTEFFMSAYGAVGNSLLALLALVFLAIAGFKYSKLRK